MITENILRVKIEGADDGSLKASLVGTEQGVVAVDKAQQAQAETAAKATAVLHENAAAAAAAGLAAQESAAAIVSATAVTGESYEQQTARLKAMVANSLEQQAANAAIGESERSLAERAAFRAMSTEEQIAATGALTEAGYTQAEMNARGAAMLAAEDRVRLASIATMQADTVATEANTVAKGMNSRVTYSLSALLDDAASGQIGRSKRELAALANETGIMASVFTPTGIAIGGVAAAIGLLVAATIKGEAEASAYNNALILTGNTAGTTANQLADMAKAMSYTLGTQHDAAAALAQVTATGKFTGDQLRLVATAALQMQQATGQAIGATIKQFSELAGDPAKAIAALNEQQHFLTLAQYDQIKALQDQGQAQDAADLAEKTYASAIAGRTAQIKQNLGTLETAWANIKTVAGSAWDAMMGVGRDMTDSERIAQLQGLLLSESQPSFASPKAQTRFNVTAGHVGWEATGAEGLASSQQIRNQIDGLNRLQAAQKLASATAQDTGDTQTAQDLGIGLAQQAAQYASAEVKRAAAIEKAHGDANAAIAAAQKVQDADLRAQLIAQAKANEQAIVAGIESHAKKKAKPKSDPFASLDKLVQTAQVSDANFGTLDKQTEQVKQILAIVDAGAKLIKSGADVVTVQSQVATGVGAVNDLFAKQAQVIKTQNLVAIADYNAAADAQLAAVQRSIDSQVAKIGMGDKEYQQQRQLNDIIQKGADTIAKYTAQRNKLLAANPDANTSVIDAQIAKQKELTDSTVEVTKRGFMDMDAAQADWSRGATSALKNYVDQAKDTADQVKQAFTGLSSDMEDSLANWVTTGKLSFSTFEKDFENMLAHMVAKALIAQAETALLGLFTGGAAAVPYDPSAFGSSYAADMQSVGGGGFGILGAPHAAGGGRVDGPGTTTSDSIPAWLSNGENVITADATNHYGQKFMDDVNNMRLPRFAQGGPVGGYSSAGGGNGAPTIIVQNNNAGSNQVSASASQQPDGSWMTKLVIDAVTGDMMRGGKTAKAMEGRYGLARRGVPVAGG